MVLEMIEGTVEILFTQLKPILVRLNAYSSLMCLIRNEKFCNGQNDVNF